MVGPKEKPRKNTPVNRLKMCALDPSEVQSDMYADVAACSVDQPPNIPSMNGEMTSNLCPCEANME